MTIANATNIFKQLIFYLLASSLLVRAKGQKMTVRISDVLKRYLELNYQIVATDDTDAAEAIQQKIDWLQSELISSPATTIDELAAKAKMLSDVVQCWWNPLEDLDADWRAVRSVFEDIFAMAGIISPGENVHHGDVKH